MERCELTKACTLTPEERKKLAAKFDAGADELMEHANDPAYLKPYANDDGERCPPPISAVGSLRQAAEKIRKGLPSPLVLKSNS